MGSSAAIQTNHTRVRAHEARGEYCRLFLVEKLLSSMVRNISTLMHLAQILFEVPPQYQTLLVQGCS